MIRATAAALCVLTPLAIHAQKASPPAACVFDTAAHGALFYPYVIGPLNKASLRASSLQSSTYGSFGKMLGHQHVRYTSND
jgi:hypothetical protein